MPEAEFRHAPEGPPSYRRRVQFQALEEWLEANPGEWAVIEETDPNYAQRLRAMGYEATATKRPDGSKVDVWVRKLPPDEPPPPRRRRV